MMMMMMITIIIILISDILKYRPSNRNTTHVECTNKIDTGNNRGDWNISESLIHYLSNIPGKHEIKELQKTAVLDTSHILWKVLM